MCFEGSEISASRTCTCLIGTEYLSIGEALAHAIETDGRMQPAVTAVADDLFDAVSSDTPPCVVLADLDLPGFAALAGAARLCAAAASTQVMILTDMPLDYAVSRLLAMGCAGVFFRSEPVGRLLGALSAVATGQAARGRAVTAEEPPARIALRPSEVAVLRCLCVGMTNAQTARRLDMPVLTVQGLVRLLCLRLGVTNRTQAALVALDKGLVSNSGA